MSNKLFVHYESLVVGELTPANDDRIQFRYDDNWVSRAGSFPISLSLPLDGRFDTSASHHFFVNLLPEASVRQQICQALRISVSNDFELLKAIGGDCAGALAITPDAERPASAGSYEPVSEEQLSAWSVGTPNAFSAVTGQNEVRLSLAGAQDKLPVHLVGEQVFVPCHGSPSTALLKFASPFYSHLPENETFVTMVASAAGLPVVDIQLRQTARARIAVIGRYDRMEQDGRFRRLHQEDFCQALGIATSKKYEKEGGPSLSQCAEVIRRHTSFPLVELRKLLQWSLFNLLVGNADAHGKNISLLYSDRHSLTLAPFYDLVCTRNYRQISRHMAMKYGNTTDPDLVTEIHLSALAADLRIRPQVVVKAMREMSDQILAAVPQVCEDFAQRYGDSPVLERIPIIVRKQIRRIQRAE
ncbi:MAG: type II toxin-antitoxin system HipA family toxin [Planctomycetaceae bacterium]|nr:type II toxin-antitoxin system HipA family toxin [Planctomycetaceae bacterium]